MEENQMKENDFTSRDFPHGKRQESGSMSTSEMEDNQMTTDVTETRANVKQESNPAGADSSSRNNFREETSVEVMPGSNAFSRDENRNNERTNAAAGKGFGYAAVIISILSLFIAPILFGIVGIVLGFMARRRTGSERLGYWAIGIGAFSIIIGVLILPFF